MSKCFSGVGNSRLLSERGPDGPCRKVLPKVICTKAVKNENKGFLHCTFGEEKASHWNLVHSSVATEKHSTQHSCTETQPIAQKRFTPYF